MFGSTLQTRAKKVMLFITQTGIKGNINFDKKTLELAQLSKSIETLGIPTFDSVCVRIEPRAIIFEWELSNAKIC